MEYTGDLIFAPMWNVFDDFGLVLGQERIDNEGIRAYKDRLFDVIKHRGGPDHWGLFYGINRDFGLTVYHDALIIQTAKRQDGLPNIDDAAVEVKANGIHVSSEAFKVIREAEIVPSDTLRIKLAEMVVSREMVVEYPLNTKADPEDYTFDWDRNEIVFHKGSYAGVTVLFSYYYYEIVPTRNRTLNQVVAGLNAITTPGGVSVLSVSLKDGIDGTLSADGIPLTPLSLIEDLHDTPTGEYYDMFRLPVGEASLRALGDPDFIKAAMGSGDVYFDTELTRYVEQARSLARMGWENLLFDATRLTDNLGVSVVPTLADPKTTWWKTSTPGNQGTYSTFEADDLGYADSGEPLRRKGFAAAEMQSGVGGAQDLKLVVEEGDQSLEFEPTVYDFITLPTGDITLTGEELTASQGGF